MKIALDVQQTKRAGKKRYRIGCREKKSKCLLENA